MSLLEKLFYSPPGKAIAARAGLHEPPVLRRGTAWPEGPIVLASLGGGRLAADTLKLLGRATTDPIWDDEPVPGYPGKIGALVIDATELRRLGELEQVRAVLRPAVRALEGSGRVVLLARGTTNVDDWEAKAVAQALDGIDRTVGKELRKGATANLIQVGPEVTPPALASTLSFLLQGRSAFVDGQT